MDLQELANIDLIKELGLDTLSQNQQEELLLQVGEVIQQRIILRIVDEMKDEDKDRFTALLDKSDENPDEVEEFLKEKVPNLDQISVEEIGRYKGELLELIKNITQGQEGA